jgi:hypothetical protein
LPPYITDPADLHRLYDHFEELLQQGL